MESIIVAIVAGVVALLGAWLTWLASGAARQAERIDTLEKRIDTLEARDAEKTNLIAAFASFVNRFGAWLEGGMHGPWPRPDNRLHAHIDAAPWTIPTPEPPTD